MAKIALVTGASRGLERDMAISLAKCGINVIITYKNSKAEADQTISAIESHGAKAVSFRLDE